MKINKKIAISILTFAVIGTAAVSAKRVFAETDTSTFPPMVQKLVEKFNLNADEVKTVLDEERQAQQEEMLTQYESMLDEAVGSGELTEDQKNLLLAKRQEWQDYMSTLAPQGGQANGTDMESRRTEMDAKRDELEQWASDNGIDEKYLFMFGEGRGHGGSGGLNGQGGFGPGGGMGNGNNSQTNSESS